MLAAQLSWRNARQTIYIDGDHRLAVRRHSIGKAFDAAGATKEMTDGFGVEQIFCEMIFARLQGEVGLRRKYEDKPHALTTGTIAGNRVTQVNIDFIVDGTALTASFVLREFHAVISILSDTLNAVYALKR